MKSQDKEELAKAIKKVLEWLKTPEAKIEFEEKNERSCY